MRVLDEKGRETGREGRKEGRIRKEREQGVLEEGNEKECHLVNWAGEKGECGI